MMSRALLMNALPAHRRLARDVTARALQDRDLIEAQQIFVLGRRELGELASAPILLEVREQTQRANAGYAIQL